MKKYTAGKESFYDDEKELYYCYVGIDDQRKTLIACIYGNTQGTAIINAQNFAEILNTNK